MAVVEVVKENFRFVRGDTFTRYFSIKKIENSPITQLYYTIKEDQDRKALVIKTLGNGIELLNEGEERCHYALTLNCTCTDRLKAETPYMHDIQVVRGEYKRTLMKGQVYLEKEATTTHCEREVK